MLESLALGFATALTLQNLGYALGGVLLGTLIGVLPGLGPVATIAMLLPTIYGLDATPALIMLAGIYYGAQYGGSTTAILINVPGEASSVVTALDGYQMARQGRAGTALATAALGSFFAGCVGTAIIVMFAPPLVTLSQQFGRHEYFSLMVLGLVGAVALGHGAPVKSVNSAKNCLANGWSDGLLKPAQPQMVSAGMRVRIGVFTTTPARSSKLRAIFSLPILSVPSILTAPARLNVHL